MHIHSTVNISQVKLYKEHLSDQPANQPNSSHIIEDWDKKYKVKYIVDFQWKRCRLEYLIHWKGYDGSEHMWEPLSNLSYVKEVLSDFILTHPNTLLWFLT